MLRRSDPAVLVTGATGFIGRHVVARLMLAGRRVVILARRRGELTGEHRVAAIFGDVSRQLLEVVEGDLANPAVIENKIRCHGSTIEIRVARMLSPYRDYLEQDVQFDDSAALRLLGRYGVEPPEIDDRELERFFKPACCSEENGALVKPMDTPGKSFRPAGLNAALDSDAALFQDSLIRCRVSNKQ